MSTEASKSPSHEVGLQSDSDILEMDTSGASRRRKTPGSGHYEVMESEVIKYINKGYKDTHIPTGEELEKAHHINDSRYPEITFRNLRKAAGWLFENGQITNEEFKRITIAFYNNFDLKKRGGPNYWEDCALLIDAYSDAYAEVMDPTTSGVRTGRVLDIGCGNGRLSVLLIELAKRTKMKEVVFNDLLPEHIEATRKYIGEVYQTNTDDEVTVIDGVKIRFEAGDFAEVAKKKNLGKFDIVTAMWFVTSEILSLVSSEELRRVRLDFFKKIRLLLPKHGIFIEDIPESGLAGFYKISRYYTYELLQERGVLMQNPNHPESAPEAINMSLTNIPDKNHPYHIRCLEFNGSHEALLKAAGFYKKTSTVGDIPTKATAEVEPDFISMFSNNTSLQIIRNKMQSLSQDFTYRDPEEPQKWRKKILYLWGARG
ncbi:MAG: class I SAM-dependent methyltransferase [Candidatus Gracilibacteria bacterium]|nr:class I SAM-dependent methyltransferase [Candidatus Gracilibacteria bacterium]